MPHSSRSAGVPLWRSTLSGLCATLVGIGLARFAYTPLIPAIIQAGWFTPSRAAYLGAANLAGYLAGAILARPMLRFGSTANLLRLMMVLATASFFACASPLGFAWFVIWRCAAGISGGVLMVVAATAVLAHTPLARKGIIGGSIFTGVGIGVATSGTLVPLLLRLSLVGTWLGLGALSAALTIIAWSGWPRQTADAKSGDGAQARMTRPLAALFVTYALNACGLVPHMIFWVDFISRGIGRGLQVGAIYWVIYGVGASAGPILAGNLADRIGFRHAHGVALLLQAVGVALPLLSSASLALVVSSLIMGGFTPGVVPLVLGRVHDLVGPAAQQDVWRWATSAFALAQATAAYGMSFVYSRTNQHQSLFEIAALALGVAFLLHVVNSRGKAELRGPANGGR